MASLRQHKKHNEEEEGHLQGSTQAVEPQQQQSHTTYSHCHLPRQLPAAIPTTTFINTTTAATMYHRTKHRLPPLHRHSSLPRLTPHSESPLSSLISRASSSLSRQRQRQRRRPLPQLHLPQFAFCFLLMGSLVPPCVAICPRDCVCDVVTFVVRCTPSNIDVIPITLQPKLQQLTMYGTEIHTLDVNSFHWYEDLRHVNLSKNMIMQVNPNTFRRQKLLEELHLAQNKISDLSAEMFFGLSNLIVLSLRKNIIESIEAAVFRHLQHLQDLDLSENRIENLEEKALTGLSNLRVLHLRDNRLTSIPATNLALIPDLAELSLGSNYFTAIQQIDFKSMRSLKSLDLSGASLNEGLTEDSFKSLSGLRKLNLESCGLITIPSFPLSALTSLEELHIGNNPFSTLPSDVFRNNHNLHSLYISGCPNLVYIERDILQANLNIKQVVITNNPQLTYIAPNALRLLTELGVLDLRHNNLQQVSEQAAAWSDIKHWYLEGNPIACNCSAAWLRALILETNSSTSLKCASPPHMEGALLRSTDISELACGLDSTTQGLVIGLVVCFLVVMITAAVVVMLYRHHDSCVHRLLKGHHIGGPGSSCDHPYTHSYHPACTVTPTKPVPVTEL
ncbi:leucine-rich repeat neuronal protein 2-like [Eriocheir sinensis]|uniref:leucine-rich repeat neuronal protein 2-like n=1 Tax=Eriocheir sinensis TaxID=95602 RepID=UPI0021C7E77A|nr:leucine-rich repeat neuronal protein 2-like [Eriocheir sinensis]XP_050686957.1 leucine-rich repeat neuronal protein 2-like [Eriocheir sinensis]